MARMRYSAQTPLGPKHRVRDERRAWLEPLLAAVLSAEPVAALRAWVAQQPAVPWRRVLDLCRYHGVAAVVLDALDVLAATTAEPGERAVWPSAALLRDARRQQAAAMLGQRPHWRMLATLREAFHIAGLRVVALKGPLLGERLWGDAARRPSSDLDFLVAPAEWTAAVRVLREHGYVPTVPRLTRRSRWRYPDVKFAPPAEPAAAPLVELHWLAAYGCGTRLDTRRLVARAEPYGDAPPAWVLEPADEFLALAIHGAKHQYERLAWLVDLVYRLAAAPPIALGTLWRRARAVGALGVLRYTAGELARLGVDLTACLASNGDPEVQQQARAALAQASGADLALALARRLAHRIHAGADYSVPTKLTRMAFHLALADGCRGRLRYLGERGAAALSRLTG